MNSGILIELHRLSPLAPLIAVFCLVYVIQAHQLESKARNSMLVYLVAMGCWSLGALILRNNRDIGTAVLCIRFMRASIMIMGAAALHFVYELLELKGRRLVYLVYAFSISMAVLSLTTRLLHAGMGENALGYYGKGTPLRHICDTILILTILGCIVTLLRYRHSRDSTFYKEANITIVAFIIVVCGAVADILPTLGVPFFPAGMLCNTAFVVLIAYGAFSHKLMGVLARPQPRIVLASFTYGLIASGLALTFTDAANAHVFVFLLCFIFLAFNMYHFYDDIHYLARKYLRFQRTPFYYQAVDDASIILDDREVGILGLNRNKEIIFSNKMAVKILGPEAISGKNLASLSNEILRKKLEKFSDHRREISVSVDKETLAEFVPIELGEFAGTLILFRPKKRTQEADGKSRVPKYKWLNLWDIFPNR